MTGEQLPAGIGWNADHRVGPSFALVCLRRTAGAPRPAVRDALSAVRDRLLALGEGRLAWLPGLRTPAGGLRTLIGYGPRAFDGCDADVAAELRESAFLPPAGTGGPVLPGVSLRWLPGLARNGADADVALQLTADTESAVTRAVVEIDRALRPPSPLAVCGAYRGYRRPDGRSWLGFLDGVDNMDSRERLGAIQVGRDADDEWLRGGTYLAFLRVHIDLEQWDALDVAAQELLVGRHLRSGVPLFAAGGAVVRPALADGTSLVTERANIGVREPLPVPADDPTGLGRSHVQRSRRHTSGPVFRQGYEFLEERDEPPLLRPGLNFVSFQGSARRLLTILRTPSWLGDASFGGPSGGPPLLAVAAAGIFAVPPREAGPPAPAWPD